MAITEKTTHESEALARIVEQLKNNPQVREMIRTWAAQIQELEAVCFDLISGRGIDTAVGNQLDGIGQIVGQSRNGASDVVYRLRLKARILLNKTSGTLPEILQIFDLLCPDASNLALRQLFPKQFRLEVEGAIDSTSAAELSQILQSARPAGTNAKLVTLSVAKSATFTFGGTAAQGFGAGLLARIA